MPRQTAVFSDGGYWAAVPRDEFGLAKIDFSSRRFIDALSRLPRFEIRLGKLEYRGINATDGKPIFEQKRVDIMLGVDMALLAAKQRIDRVAILTGDSDFIPALKVAKNEGILVHPYHGDPASVHREIWVEADDRTRIEASVIEQIQMR